MLLYIDEADPSLPEYRKMISESEASVKTGPFLWLAEVVNAAVGWNPEVPYFQIINDDHFYRTPRWDEKLISAIEQRGGWGYAYGRTENFPTAAVISSNIIKALGFYFPPGFRHQFVDNYEQDLFGGAGMAIHVPGVWIEHMHPGFGKGVMDETYAKVQREAFSHDAQRYEQWKQNERDRNIASLIVARSLLKA